MLGIFMLYGALASLAGIFYFFILPETKGKTLEEIDLELRLNRCSTDWLINKKRFFLRKNINAAVQVDVFVCYHLQVLSQRRMLQFRQLEKQFTTVQQSSVLSRRCKWRRVSIQLTRESLRKPPMQVLIYSHPST